MIGLALSALLAGAMPAPATTDGHAAAAAEIRRALECEAEGLRAERDEHLAAAARLDPADARARGLLGQVADRGGWARPAEVTERDRADTPLARALAEYERRRDAASEDSADEQWRLALWCERAGLIAEARAHFTRVTGLDPGREAAWKRLGRRKSRGRWLSDEQIAAERAEAEAQARADHAWRPRLATWRAWLRDGAKRPAAIDALAGLKDPRAFPAVWRVFAVGPTAATAAAAVDQRWALRAFDGIESPAASRGLAALAVAGKTERVREEAADRLGVHDPSAYVGFLINLLRDPARVLEVREDSLLVETTNALFERSYQPFADGSWTPGDAIAINLDGGTLDSRGRRAKGFQVNFARNSPEEARRAGDAVRRERDADLAELARLNDAVEEGNNRVRWVLTRAVGRDLGKGRDVWASWWSDQLGYTYQTMATQPAAKPLIVENVRASYSPPPPVATVTGRYRSCFAAGTPVLTRAGLRPIEALRVGDLVLAQDIATGALEYQPIVATFHNPPHATLRVDLGREALVATPIHRFWRVGRGWAMARDLRPGDLLRTLDGPARVERVTPDDDQPVFNLEVAARRDYFVGRSSALVHDNTLIEPTPAPFDAPPPADH